VTLRLLIGAVAAGAVLTVGAGGASGRGERIDETACTAATTKTLVRSFVRNYSAGHVAIINRMFAPKPRFQWYSTGKPGERIGRPAYVRSNLARYFRSRVRVHERLRLTELHAGYDPAREIVNFSGKLVRSADDIRPRRSPHDFKGAADCVAGRPMLIVWSM
jgi:hypothetical protein